jgi:predicted XRE-type DNA-binding protein
MRANIRQIDFTNKLQNSSFVWPKGTAGSISPTSFDSTGGIKIFFTKGDYDKKIEKDLFSREINNFLKSFNLGKDQLSKILHISRPTLNAWLNNENSRLTETNLTRVRFIKDALSEVGKTEYAASFGPMLRKRLDEDCFRLYDALVSEKLDMDEIKSAIKQAKYRFIGQKNSLLLDKLLSNAEPLA